MKKYVLTFVLLLFFSGVATAAESGTLDYSVSPYKIGKIKKVTVTAESAKYDVPDPKISSCDSWKITQKQSEFFFRHAKKVSMAKSLYEGVNSPCYSAGTIELANGDKGEWTISPGSTGTLTVNIGKPNEAYISLYCKTCDDQDMGSVTPPAGNAGK